MGRAGTFSSTSAYLVLAARAIELSRRPLTPLEMLEIGQRHGFVPEHLFGATMHKTLAARLAEHIRGESDGSDFYRTAPGKFFLHKLAKDPSIPQEYKHVHRGHLRSKAIRKENVLVAPKRELNNIIFGEFTPFDNDEFIRIYQSICHFHDRQKAEEDNSIKQFVTFTLFFHGHRLLIHRRGKFSTASDLLKGQISVGFGGHVNDKDFDLFNRGGDAFRANAARELKEELFLDEIYRERYDAIERTNILGFVNVEDSPDAQHHIAVLVAFEHSSAELPKKGELSINQLSWLNLETPLNDLSGFDLWSGMILKNIFTGRIKLTGV